MSYLHDLGNAALNVLDLQQTADGAYEAIYNYSQNPNADTAAKMVGFLSSQLAGHLLARLVDRLVPSKGEKFLWDSLKKQFDKPQSMEDARSKLELEKAALGFLIGIYIEKMIEATGESEWMQDNIFSHIFPYYDLASEKFGDFLNWWDPLGINPDVNNEFLLALNFVQRIDPLVIDLDGDGIETVGADSGIVFDFDGDGVKTGTGWIKKDDGFLVLDRNNNGSIDDGGELFGVDTVKKSGQKAANGFDAIGDLDSNGDGVFDASDEAFSDVKVWQDLNQDGIAQPGELKSLAEHGIAAINLGSKSTSEASNGNLITAVGSFVRIDGSEGVVNGNQSLVANLDLASNPFYREYLNDSSSIEDKYLPGLKGSGAVRDLHHAATSNSSLSSALSAYALARTREEQIVLVDDLITKWAESSDYKTLFERIDDMKHGVIPIEFSYSWELPGKFAASSSSGGGNSGIIVGGAEHSGEEGKPTAEQLEKQELLNRVRVLEVFNGQNFFNFSSEEKKNAEGEIVSDEIRLVAGASTRTKSTRRTGSLSGIPSLIYITEEDLVLSQGQADLINQSYEKLRESVYDGLLLQTRLKAYFESVVTVFTDEGPKFDFSSAEKLFLDAAGSDPVKSVVDLVDFRKVLKEHISAYTFDGVLTKLVPYLTDLQVAHVVAQLGNGSPLIIGDSFASFLSGSSASEFMYGRNGDDTLTGGAGDDFLHGGAGNDTLDGGTGTNHLYGGEGDDTLMVNYNARDNVFEGGKGNDTLHGSYNSDTYVFNLGDGQDTIVETGANSDAVDILRFGTGIVAGDIQVQKRGTDLVFVHANGLDQVLVKNWFSSDTNALYGATPSARLERVEFADGTAWTQKQVESAVVSQGTAADDKLIGWSGNDIMYGGAGNDTLDGGTGTNHLYGGEGDDTLMVNYNARDNVFEGGKGNDTLHGSYNSDTYVFNLGDGQDTIVETGSNSDAVDILRFGADLSPENLWFQRNGQDLDISILGSEDRMTVSNWYAGSGNRVEVFQTHAGLALTESRVQSLVDAMAAFGVPSGAEVNLTQTQRESLDVVIAANWQ